jgi:hypothetical protein
MCLLRHDHISVRVCLLEEMTNCDITICVTTLMEFLAILINTVIVHIYEEWCVTLIHVYSV